MSNLRLHKTLYDLGVGLYFGGISLVALANPKARLMQEGRRETLRLLEQRRDPHRDYVWIHASSVGEFEQGRPLIERIKAEHPQLGICLTFYSPSGYTMHRNYPLADLVTYLPYDTSSDLPLFLDLLKPRLALFVKYEIWYHTLALLKQRGIPSFLISANFRSGQIFFKPYGGLLRQALETFDHIFVQTDTSRKLLHSIGIDRVTVCGDTRTDRVLQIQSRAERLPLFEELRSAAIRTKRLVYIAGSSWEQDESIYLPALLGEPKKYTIVIAPHELSADRLAQLQRSITAQGGIPRLLSEAETAETAPSPSEVLIVDRMGLLSTLYRYADIAYIGGGFGKGIHNTLEAAVYGIPILFGPNHGKFEEAKGLLRSGGAFTVRSSSELSSILRGLTSDSADRLQAGKTARQYVESRSGATEQIYRHLLPLLGGV